MGDLFIYGLFNLIARLNDFIEHLSYYTSQVSPDQLYVFTYFVFIREMMHHLRVEEIHVM
ncbi:hypothetical protein EEW84_08870 [Acinetobacter baumannii]|nr:hypothetical protein EEW84_08870 [Acinetobacter baumannii]